MRIAVAQMKSRAGDFRRTCERMLSMARSARSKGAELVVYPYALLTGTTAPDYPDRMGYVIDLLSALDGLAEQTPCPLLVSLCEELNPFGSPVAVLVDEDGTRPLEGAGEGAGRRRGFDVAGVRLDVAYTYDELDDLLFEESDAQVALFVNSSGFAVDDPASAMGAGLATGTLPRDVAERGLWVVGAASLGCYDGEVFCGSSFVLAPWGELAAQAPAFEEDLLLADVDPSSEGPLAEPLAFEVYDRLLTTWQALALGLGELLASEGQAQAALVLDGRLASSALCVLAVDALGPTRVHALLAPSGSDELDRAARSLAASLRVDARPADVPAGVSGDDLRDLCACRLAALARETFSVPLSDADKTGLALEAGMALARVGVVAPFGDVYRSDVIDLARMRNTISPVMSQATLAAFDVPSVGVRVGGSSPEGRLELIDAAVSGRVDWERTRSEVALGVGNAELATAVLDSFEALELSRVGAPRVIRATARTLFEARRPLGSVWGDALRGQGDVEALVADLRSRLGLVDDGPLDDDEPGGDELRDEAEDVVRLLRDMAEQGGLASFGEYEGGQQGSQRRRGSGGPFGNPFSEN